MDLIIIYVHCESKKVSPNPQHTLSKDVNTILPWGVVYMDLN